MFRFRLDGSSGVPPYLQLVHQVRQSLLLGYLRAGDRLPTVKEVAVDLAINPNTVVKAYRQLEHEGLAGGRPGQGTFITGTLASPSAQASEALRESLERWLHEAAEAGLSDEAVTALIAAVRHDVSQGVSRRPYRRDQAGRRGADRGERADLAL
jgi:GntR family transcriptional regulator